MKIQHKSSLLIFSVGTVFLIIFSTGYYFQHRDLVVSRALSSAYELVKGLAYHVEEHMEKDAQLAYTLANAPLITESLNVSNSDLASLTENDRELKIASLNSRWMHTEDVNDPFIQNYMSNPVAAYLNKQQAMFPDFFGEIFLTNRYGVIIATTKKLTTLAHSHKYWWIGSYYDGRGRTFFDDRGYDKSVEGYVLGIVVPIIQGNEVLGILKCNIKILGSYNHSIDEFTNSNPGNFSLVRSKGLVIFEKDVEPLSRKIPDPLIEKMKTWKSESLIMTLNGTKKIISYSPVSITHDSALSGFGGSSKSIDHTKGNEEEGWFVVSSIDIQETLAGPGKLDKRIALTGLLLVLLMAITAMISGKRIASPLSKLAKMAKNVGEGDFKTEIKYSSRDELGILARSFNKMIHRLRETTTSRDKLVEEIRQREEVEKKSAKLAIQLHQAKKMESFGTMAGGIVHNFNNILTVILGNVEMARDDLHKENTVQPYLRDTLTAANRARDLVGHLISFSNQASTTNNVIEPVPLLHDYLGSIRDKIPADITVEEKFNPDINRVCLESNELKTVADNLCLNALWAMRSGGGILGLTLDNITLESDDSLIEVGIKPGHFVKLTVSDTGCGMNLKDQELIFDPFFSTKETGDGEGIGLSEIHGIVRKAGGIVTFESAVDEGSTFHVFLPTALKGSENLTSSAEIYSA